MNARTARTQRKATPSAERRASLRVLRAKDTRQPIKLDPQKATGANLRAMIEQAIQQVLSSDAARLIVSGYVEGRDLQGAWGVRLKDHQVGDLYLVPQRDELEPETAAEAVAE